MVQRRKAKTSPYLWYALYAVVGYYGYNWWMKRQVMQTTMVSVPSGTQT